MNAWDVLEQLFHWLLQASGHAAVIALVILLAQFLLRNRLSPAWRYGLWFLLIARLLMPITVSSAVSIFNLVRWPRAAATLEPIVPEALPKAGPPLTEPAPARIEMVDAPVTAPTRATELTPEPLPPLPPRQVASPSPVLTRKSLDWAALTTGVWLAGTVLLAVRFVWIENRFQRRLTPCRPLKDEKILALLNGCARSLNVKRIPLLIETEASESPAVYGLGRKRLLLPEGLCEALPPEGLRHILLHELAHIKRRDPELNWLVALLQIVHWFNPVLWFAFARMRADREVATDDLALAHTQAEDRRSYGETILQVLEGLTRQPALPGLIGIGESKNQIKERMRAIARAGGRHWTWAAGIVTVVLAGIALTNAREEKPGQGIDLLKRYPTTLTAGDTVPGHARRWQFTGEDIFQVAKFSLDIADKLHVETGTADVGIGHCADGAVWAVVIPRQAGTLTSSAAANPEKAAHVWLRFHPAEIDRILPPETVLASGQSDLEERIQHIADRKMNSSWQAGNRAMIPGPKDMTVDVDTVGGPRRFFVVDTRGQTAEYVAAFAGRSVEANPQPAYAPEADTNCASVVSVSPADGAQNVQPKQDLRIRFDRPMNAYNLKLGWIAGGFQLTGPIRVSAGHKEFVVPVQLVAGEQKLVLNRDAERERWVALGRRPEMKPADSRRGKGGFADAQGLAANEFRWSFSVKGAPADPGAAKPRVVSVSPPSGSTTPVLVQVEITFDQPMRPPEQGLPYVHKNALAEGPSLIPSFECDASARRFSFPALLRPEDDVRLTLKGFYSAAGAPCDPVILHYQTGSEDLDSKYVQRAKTATQDPKLRQLLASMQQARARLNSGTEIVQSIRLNLNRNSFTELEAQTAVFRWQGNDQVYADISGPMGMDAFILGSNGRQCWLYSQDEKGEKRLDQTPGAVTERNILLLDPFALQTRSVEEVLDEAEMVRASSAPLEGRACYRLEKWDVRQDGFGWATLTQWWIDEQTLLPSQIVQYYPAGCQIFRFTYRDLNQTLAAEAFEAPAQARNGARPFFYQDPPQPGERRFLQVCDGSNGRMSGRFGWHGPNGTTSSGMN